MRAAVYARKSTEQNVADDAKPVTRQVELARAFAAKQGWTVAESHVYIDDGISGAEFVDRPGLMALTQAARGKPRLFDVLVTMDVDRIGREQYAVASELLKIVQSGVRVFFYATGQELKLDTPISKITLSLQGYAAEDYRHQIQTKTKEALHRKAAHGFVANGKVLGYVNVREAGGVKRVAKGRRIVRSLLDGPITLTRVADGWEYRGKTVINRAIRGRLGWRVLAADLEQSPTSSLERSHA